MFRTIKRFVSLWKKVSRELNAEILPSHKEEPTAKEPTAVVSELTPASGVPVSPVSPKPKAPGFMSNPNGHLALPLRSILAKLSPDCMRLVRQLDVGDALVFLSAPHILEQIPKGAVRIPFSELKKSSPPGVFSNDTILDKVLVELPLQEIIARLDPSLMARRTSQQHVYLPNEITAPFAGEEKGAVAVSAPVTSPEAFIRRTTEPMVVSKTASSTTSFTKAVTKPELNFTAQAAAASAQSAVPATKSTPSTSFLKADGSLSTTSSKANGGSDTTTLTPSPVTYQNSFNTSMIRRVGTPLTPQKSSDLTAPQPDVFSRATPESTATDKSSRVYTPIDSGASPVSNAPTSSPSSEGSSSIRLSTPNIISPIAPGPVEEPAPIRFQFPQAETEAQKSSDTSSVKSPVVPGTDSTDTRTIKVSICELSGEWPDVIQQEIQISQIGSSVVSFPMPMIQVAIKQGKVALPWRIIRSWVKSATALASSPNDAFVLELPLKVITPLFLSELKGTKVQRKIQIDETIPDLFSGGKTSDTTSLSAAKKPVTNLSFASAPPVSLPLALPKPAASSGAVPINPVNSGAPITTPNSPVADTNYFSRPETDEINKHVTSDGLRPPSLGTKFLHRYATPNEIVSKAAALDGVCGALVALPDGLLVASEIPSTMNAHTVAAFLPQMFARVSQCTKELRLGDLNNLSFTVGVVPWKIFKVGSIYFAAFGHENVQMPTSQLAGIAAELDRNPR